MKLEHWRIFVTVAEAKSLVTAARRLGKTPSGVSMSLRQLERELGDTLFESERKNQLTDLGRLLLTEARRNLASFDASVQRLQDHVKARGSTLRIGAVPSAMRHLLPPLFDAFQRRCPAVHLELRDMDSAALQESLELGHLDLVVRSHEMPIDNPWIEDRLGWVVTHSASNEQLEQLKTEQLTGLPLVSNRLCQGSQHVLLQAVDNASKARVFSTESLLSMVRINGDITVLPELACKGQSGIQFIPIPNLLRRLKLHVGEKPSAECQAFYEMAFEDAFSGQGLV